MIFSKVFAGQSGMINFLLTMIGFDPIGWHPAHIGIANMVSFRWAGYNVLIIIAVGDVDFILTKRIASSTDPKKRVTKVRR